jgi:hypothetical protein
MITVRICTHQEPFWTSIRKACISVCVGKDEYMINGAMANKLADSREEGVRNNS